MKQVSKLQQQIFGVAAILSIFIVFLLGVAISVILYSKGVQNAEAVIRNKNLAVATLIQGYFAPLRQAVEFSAGEVAGIDHTHFKEAAAQQRILNMYSILQGTIPNINYVYSGYEDGSLIINDYTPPEGFDATLRPWYQAAIEAHPNTSDGVPYLEVTTEEWLVSIGKTLTDQDNQILGVLAIDASIDTVVQALSAQDSDYPTAYSYVLDNQGIALIHDDLTLRGTFHEAAFNKLPGAKVAQGNFTYQNTRGKRIAHFTRLDDLGWIVMTAVPKSDVLRPIQFKILLSLGIIIMAALIAAWLVSYLLSRNIIRPLNQLQKRVQGIVEGNKASAHSDELPNNEIGVIAEAIEGLTEAALVQKNLELQTKNSLLDSLSKTDQLTGIPNRRRMQQVLEEEISRFERYKSPFCILLFDIDHFKAVNDTYGHEVGDQVIIQLTQVIQAAIRDSDYFGRWGGEEFVMVCPETRLDGALALAENLRSSVQKQNFVNGLVVTISLGVCEFKSGATLKETLVKVDQKMYLAKEKGRNRIES